MSGSVHVRVVEEAPKMWAASLVAHSKTVEGYRFAHVARLIKSESEPEATAAALQMAGEIWPDEGWEYSVALDYLHGELKGGTLGLGKG